MKRIINIALVILCLLSLTGCADASEPADSQIVFYYPRVKINYGHFQRTAGCTKPRK